MQVINIYKEKNLLVEANADDTVDNIFNSLIKQFNDREVF
jgi:hypothetical protein